MNNYDTELLVDLLENLEDTMDRLIEENKTVTTNLGQAELLEVKRESDASSQLVVIGSTDRLEGGRLRVGVRVVMDGSWFEFFADDPTVVWSIHTFRSDALVRFLIKDVSDKHDLGFDE